jgi:membrane protease YdiL (CAAX protease family)
MKNPLGSLNKMFKQSYTRLAAIPFIFLLIAIEVYFWINGRAHFPNWDDSYGTLIQVYLVMTIIFLLWSGRGTQEQMRRPLQNSVVVFVLFFVGTYIILFFVSLTGAITPGTLDPNLFWQTVMIQVCVVACAEELMFRGVILEMMGVLVSAVLFAAWHAWAYGAQYYNFSIANINILAFAFAFVMGLVFAMVARQKNFGIVATVGIHSAYNLFIVGAFYALNVVH